MNQESFEEMGAKIVLFSIFFVQLPEYATMKRRHGLAVGDFVTSECSEREFMRHQLNTGADYSLQLFLLLKTRGKVVVAGSLYFFSNRSIMDVDL